MRRLLGVCVLTAPLMIILSEALSPALSDDGAASLRLLEDHPVRFQLYLWVGLLAAVLLLPAILGLLSLAPGRGQRLARSGAFFSGLGVVGYAAHQGMFLPLPTLLVGDRAEMAALYERQGTTPESGILIFLVFLLPLFVGLVLLGVAAALSGTAPWWPAVTLALAFAPGFLPLPFDAGYLSFALLALSLGAYGVRLVRSPAAAASAPMPAGLGTTV